MSISPFSHLNDGSSQRPRLRVGATLWGLHGLPLNAEREWTLEEKLQRVCEARFEHIECWLRDEEARTRVPRLVHDCGLKLALGHRPMTPDDTLEVIEYGASVGAEFILCQPATAYHDLTEVEHIVRAGAARAAECELGYFVETHRGNFTETIRQTLELIAAIPEICLTADFSHFVVGGEFYGWGDEGALERLRPIIERVAHVHGRISNGEAVQVDVGDGQTNPSARFFVQMWTEIFRSWRQRARPGDVIAFSSELGPPRYAITLPDGREFSDRWEQSLVMKRLAEEAWGASI